MRKLAIPLVLLLIAALSLGAIACGGGGKELPVAGEGETTVFLSSTAFQDGEEIPETYTCEGDDVSPSLMWSEPPQGTRTFALIMDDPDAPGGVFTHWVLFNIPSDTLELLKAVPGQEQLPSGALQGENGFGKIGYGGPCPPSGRSHRYRFTLFALDQSLNLEARASRNQILDAMEGHVLGRGQLTGLYQR